MKQRSGMVTTCAAVRFANTILPPYAKASALAFIGTISGISIRPPNSWMRAYGSVAEDARADAAASSLMSGFDAVAKSARARPEDLAGKLCSYALRQLRRAILDRFSHARAEPVLQRVQLRNRRRRIDRREHCYHVIPSRHGPRTRATRLCIDVLARGRALTVARTALRRRRPDSRERSYRQQRGGRVGGGRRRAASTAYCRRRRFRCRQGCVSSRRCAAHI